eukprot:886475-Rhodomonas_salina.2
MHDRITPCPCQRVPHSQSWRWRSERKRMSGDGRRDRAECEQGVEERHEGFMQDVSVLSGVDHANQIRVAVDEDIACRELGRVQPEERNRDVDARAAVQAVDRDEGGWDVGEREARVWGKRDQDGPERACLLYTSPSPRDRG